MRRFPKAVHLIVPLELRERAQSRLSISFYGQTVLSQWYSRSRPTQKALFRLPTPRVSRAPEKNYRLMKMFCYEIPCLSSLSTENYKIKLGRSNVTTHILGFFVFTFSLAFLSLLNLPQFVKKHPRPETERGRVNVCFGKSTERNVCSVVGIT